MQRIIIEFYDPDFLENIASLFGESFDRIIYICPKEETDLEQNRVILRNFIYKRFHIHPEFVRLEGHPMLSVLERLEELTTEEADYTFDITGGSPEFIAAMGFFAARHPEKSIFIRQYDVERGTLRFTYPPEAASERRISLPVTLEEIISLSGSAIRGRNDVIRYDLDKGSLRDDILTLWDSVHSVMSSWNNFSVLPNAGTEDRRDGFFAKQVHRGAMRHFETISERLCRAGMMSDVSIRETNTGATVFYRLHVDRGSRFLFEKGGNLMEMVCYLTAMESGAFEDCCVGVELDWDKSKKDTAAAPYNEVDLLLLHGHTPVFASCKSTETENDHLYEIAVMARHYGGVYAKPVLLSGAKNTLSIRNRAKEMGIIFLDDICSKSADELIAYWRFLFP
jgi:hypothetical protein